MSMWTAIVIIVAIACFANMQRAKYGRRDAGFTGDFRQLTSSREAELEREIDDLRQRIAVLERIATDDRKSRAISDEIESLRDR
jgi:hypothetical protein